MVCGELKSSTLDVFDRWLKIVPIRGKSKQKKKKKKLTNYALSYAIRNYRIAH